MDIFSSMFGNMDMIEATLEIYIGNQLVQSEQMQAPEMILKNQFINVVQQLSQQQGQSMSCKLIVKDYIYDQFEKERFVVDNSVEYANYQKWEN